MNKLLVILFSAMLLIIPGVVAGANAVALIPVPDKTTLAVGGTVSVDVFAESPGQALNAVSGSFVFPDNVSVSTISTQGSIVNFWTEQPRVSGNKVQFEGVVMNPGYQGMHGRLFTVVFTAEKEGSAILSFSNGAILANDGFGTNILNTLKTATIAIGGATPPTVLDQSPASAPSKPVILPVITEYSQAVTTDASAYLKGKGEPNALTKIVFKDISLRSMGERFVDFVRTKKTALDSVLVKNDATGAFQYTSRSNLIAGVYNATPFLVDESTNTERPGLGVQLLVTDNKLVHALVIVINVLGLLVPIVGLIVLIYFIPWYSARRMHLLKRQLGLEEEKIELTEHRLQHKDNTLDTARDRPEFKSKN